MLSLRCKKILSTLLVFITFLLLLISLALDTGNQQSEYVDILIIISLILFPISIISSIYYCGIIENINSVNIYSKSDTVLEKKQIIAKDLRGIIDLLPNDYTTYIDGKPNIEVELIAQENVGAVNPISKVFAAMKYLIFEDDLMFFHFLIASA